MPARKHAPPKINPDLDLGESVERIGRDLIKISKGMSLGEVRSQVDIYYQVQHTRLTAESQIRAAKEANETHDLLDWAFVQNFTIEKQIKRTLEYWTDGQPMGLWLKKIDGIGPVIAAGLLAHIDITKAPTAGHIWNFAGLNPDITWEKGKKRPWNATLKTLVWKAGDSFVMVCNKETAQYGHLYKQRKEIEIAKNEAGEFKAQAEASLKKFKWDKNTESYKTYMQGKLPPAHIHARACRYAVKIFLSHLHKRWYEWHFKQPAPKPYAEAILGHAHMIEAPPGPEPLEESSAAD